MGDRGRIDQRRGSFPEFGVETMEDAMLFSIETTIACGTERKSVACPRLRGHVENAWKIEPCPRKRGHATDYSCYRQKTI
jgi:hypothetical protein